MPKWWAVFYPWASRGFHKEKSGTYLGDRCQGTLHAFPAAAEPWALSWSFIWMFSRNWSASALPAANTWHLQITSYLWSEGFTLHLWLFCNVHLQPPRECQEPQTAIQEADQCDFALPWSTICLYSIVYMRKKSSALLFLRSSFNLHIQGMNISWL